MKKCFLAEFFEVKNMNYSEEKWIPIEEVDKYSTEEKMIKIYNKSHKKIKESHIV